MLLWRCPRQPMPSKIVVLSDGKWASDENELRLHPPDTGTTSDLRGDDNGISRFVVIGRERVLRCSARSMPNARTCIDEKGGRYQHVIRTPSGRHCSKRVGDTSIAHGRSGSRKQEGAILLQTSERKQGHALERCGRTLYILMHQSWRLRNSFCGNIVMMPLLEKGTLPTIPTHKSATCRRSERAKQGLPVISSLTSRLMNQRGRW